MKPHTDPNASSHLAERQMLFSEVKSRAASTKPAGVPTCGYRFITIARSVGALGDEIAAELATRLKWRLYDKEIVDTIAHDSHVRQGLVQELDERAQSLIHDMVARLLLMAAGVSFGNEEYHEALMKTLALLAARGEAIIVGRGGAYALQDEHGLHLRIVGSSEIRMQRLSRHWNMPLDAARRRMEQIDAQRRSFVQQHFHRDIDDLRFYNAVFNTDRQTVAQIADAVMGMVKAVENPRHSVSTPVPADSPGQFAQMPGTGPCTTTS